MVAVQERGMTMGRYKVRSLMLQAGLSPVWQGKGG